MNLLASIHLYLPQHSCGSENMIHQVLKYMISKGHRCRVALHHATKYDVTNDYEYEGVEVIVGKACAKPDTYRWADIVLTHLDKTSFTVAMMMEARRPLIQFVHNNIPYIAIQGNKNAAVVYNSKWIADELSYSNPSTIFHPPCDYRVYDTGEQQREYITLVSLNERKGGYMFYQIAKAMPDRKFLGVWGSYDNPGKLHKTQGEILNELLQLPNYTHVPNTPNILSTYARTRILLMPSDYESWGRTATEAMASGIPVICTPTPGLKENCQHAGIYVGDEITNPVPGEACVDIGTVDDWVKAIQSLDSPTEYQKYSVACRQRAVDLDPVKELEALEQFFYNVKSNYISR